MNIAVPAVDKINFLNDLEKCVNDEDQFSPVMSGLACLTIYTNMKNYYGRIIPDRQIESFGCDCSCVSILYPYLLNDSQTGEPPAFTVSIRCTNLTSAVHIFEVPSLSKARRMILKICCQEKPFRIKCYASKQEAKTNLKKFIIQQK